MKRVSLLLISITFLWLIGCSAQQTKLSSELNTYNVDKSSDYVLKQATVFKAKSSKETLLRSGTRWKMIGSIEHGDVYRTADQVVQVNSFNVQEADIVVRDTQIVGYYLPIAKTFVKAIKHVPILFIKTGEEK